MLKTLVIILKQLHQQRFVDNGLENDVTPPTGAIVSPPAGLTVSDVQIIIALMIIVQ